MTNKERQAEQSWDDFLADDADKENEERRKAVESIKTLYGIKQGRLEFERAEKEARVILDAWFQGHPDERELFDGESGFKAFMRPGGSTTSYDSAAAIKEREPALYRRLEELACLVLDPQSVKNAVAKGWIAEGDVAPFKHSISRSDSLIVEKVKE